MDHHLAVLEHPVPAGPAGDPHSGFVAADHARPAQPGQDRRDLGVEPAPGTPEQAVQRPLADFQGEQVGEQPGQPLVADRVDEPQVQRHRQDREPERRALLQSLGHRGHGDAATARALTGEPLDPPHHRAHRRQVDLVVAAMQDLVGRAQPGAAVRAHAGRGDDGLVGLGAQRPAAALAAHAAGPRPGALALAWPVGLAIGRRRLAGIVRGLRRLAQLRLELRDPSLLSLDQTHQLLNPFGQRPQGQDQAILLGFTELAQVRRRIHASLNPQYRILFTQPERFAWRETFPR